MSGVEVVLEGVSKTFEDGRIGALTDVSLRLESGESPASGPKRRVSRLLGMLVLGAGAFVLAREWVGLDPERSTRMAPLAAGAFVLVGGSLLSLDREAGPSVRPSEVLVAPVFLVAFGRLTAHLYGVRPLQGTSFLATMALNSSVALLLLVGGILSARPDRGFMRLFTSASAAGASLRRLGPVVGGGLLAIGWLRFRGEDMGLYDLRTGVALMVVGTFCLVLVVAVWNARILHRQEATRARAETISRSRA